jgi:tetratricopeptide (TPR) repeat protein
MTGSPSRSAACPACGEDVAFSRRRNRHYCDSCQVEFNAPVRAIEPQTVFLSYAHRSERDEDFDLSEDLVLLIKAELERDGHRVWLDRERIHSGSQWRERITAAILDHAHFLSFLSIRSVRDPGVCLNEIATALGSSRHIQTVLAEDERRVSPPLTISHIQWHDFQHWREIRAGTSRGPDGEAWETWFARRMAVIRDALSDAGNARISGELNQLRDVLDPRSFEARVASKTAGFHGRQWLFDAVREWLDGSTHRIFWLRGSPGIGKSAFAARLSHQARSAVIGFFMCDFQGRKDPEESARDAICTLAFQIASRLPDYRLKLLYQQRVSRDRIGRRTADELFEYLITEPLNRSGKIPESTRLCLVIDGLDEAGRSDGRNALAELLYRHAANLPPWLGVLVTSRPEPSLMPIMRGLDAVAVQADGEANETDLRAWIDEALPGDVPDRPGVIQAVLDKAGGSFLYVSLMKNESKLRAPDDLPVGLDGVFLADFRRYLPDLRDYGESAEPILRLIAAAPGPLPLAAIEAVLQRSRRVVFAGALQPLGSYLVERDGGWAFFHASLRDWLNDPARSPGYAINPTGEAELGAWLWAELDRAPDGPFGTPIGNWLPELAPFTPKWNEATALARLADFSEQRRRYLPVRAVRLRILELRRRAAAGQSGLDCAAALDGLARNFTESSVGHLGRPHYECAIESLEEAYRIRRAELGDAHELTILTLARIPYGEAGRYDLGRRALEVAVQHVSLLGAAQRAGILAAYAYYLYEHGDFTGARAIYSQLIEEAGLSNRARCTAWALMGFIEHELGRWQAALEACATARRFLDSAGSFDDQLSLGSTIDINAAMALSRLGRHEEARALVDAYIKREEATMPADSPWLCAKYMNQALIHFRSGDPDHARALAARGARLGESLLAEVHFEATVPGMLQAWFELKDGEGAAAIRRLTEAVRVRHQTLPAGHWRIRIAEENLACALRAAGRTAEADAIALGWATPGLQDTTAEPLLATLRQLCRHAAAQCRASRPQQALDAVVLALALMDSLDGTRIPESQTVRATLRAFERRLESVTHD